MSKRLRHLLLGAVFFAGASIPAVEVLMTIDDLDHQRQTRADAYDHARTLDETADRDLGAAADPDREAASPVALSGRGG